MEMYSAFQVLRRRMWMMLGIMAIGSVLAGVFSVYGMTPSYQAQADLLINGNEGKDGATLDMSTISTNIALMDSYKEIIVSKAILNKAAASIPDLGLAGKDLSGKVQIESVPNSQVMTIRATDSDYRNAVRIANAIAMTFKNEIPAIMKVNNVTLLNEADPNDVPDDLSPSPIVNIVIAVVVSAVLSAGLAFLLDYLDDTYKSEADVERILGLPVFARVRFIRAADLRLKESAASKPSQPSHKAGEQTYVTANH
ncbi:YveK family protein [Cohnella sp. CFH 77786]|uniref:YveK family protein n=1 Tax=Cohnella sp. CFH 77786 TaxID=2662265 RepID=UPI001C60916D|nr:Wzz/FepE/Etk N-terminal domain-containing protein [Cohnella sp. CFH 77786]